MNINAGISSYNLNLKKNKEEKRPTFATIFDKLDARSKKLNSKNPLNAVLTNEQQYRYYLQETEPMLHNNDDTFDLDDVVGNKSLKDMKLSEFAKLLSGNLENDVSNRYETLQAIVSSNASAPLVPSSITISSAVAAPAPVVPPPATPAAPAPPPSGSSGTGTAPPAAPAPPPSGSSGTGTAPSAAPSAAAPPPSGGGGGSGTAPAAAPAAAPSAAPAGSGLSVAIPPAGSGGGSTPTGSTAGGVISGIASAASGLLSSAKSLLSSPKPPTGGPSGTSVPTSAVASAATTAPATGVPTATPVTGAATPAGGGSGTAAAGGVSPSAVASSLASGDEGNYNIWFKGTITGTNQLTYNNALKAGLSPPKVPNDIKTDFSSTNLKWVNHIKAMNDYNELLQRDNKDPTGEYSFTFTGTQENLIKALKANGNDAQVVFEGIKDKSINLKDYETPKPPKPPAGGGGAKSGKGGKKKK